MTSEPSADLAYLKRLALAGQGRAAPALVLMAVFGLTYGLSFLAVHFSVTVGFQRVADSPLGPLVGGSVLFSHLAFLVALAWTGWRFSRADRPRISRAAGAVWSGAFVAFVVAVLAIRLFSRDQLPTDAVYAAHFLGPVLLMLWGMAWWATAFLTERRWLLLVSAGSFGFAIAIAWVGNHPPLLALMGASLLLLAVLPAVVLLRERRE